LHQFNSALDDIEFDTLTLRIEYDFAQFDTLTLCVEYSCGNAPGVLSSQPIAKLIPDLSTRRVLVIAPPD
jgi:hypothetical protein